MAGEKFIITQAGEKKAWLKATPGQLLHRSQVTLNPGSYRNIKIPHRPSRLQSILLWLKLGSNHFYLAHFYLAHCLLPSGYILNLYRCQDTGKSPGGNRCNFSLPLCSSRLPETLSLSSTCLRHSTSSGEEIISL